MIALCRSHHIQSDHGAFTRQQLEGFKRTPQDSKLVRGRFAWMRKELLAFVGGNLYQNYRTIFRFKGEPIIWFERDEEGYILLNLKLLNANGERRAEIRNNDWANSGLEDDIEVPPSARRIRITYLDGDRLAVEFYDIADSHELARLQPQLGKREWEKDIRFPITAVDVSCHAPSVGITFGPKSTSVGTTRLTNQFYTDGECALDYD